MADRDAILASGEEVLAASLEAMAVIDGERVVSVNQAFADLYGFTRPADVEGESWASYLAEDERSRFNQDILPACEEGGQWSGEITGRRRDGSLFTQELSITPLGGGQFVCAAREVDTDGSTETEIANPSLLLEHVFDAIDDILYVLDEDGESLVHWNAKLCEVTGYTDDEIADLHPKEFIVADQHEYVPGLAEAITQLEDQHVDLDLVTKDGERIPHEFRGTTFEDPSTGDVFRCGLARDITERKERERELRDAQQFNEELVENAPFGMYRLDEELRITYENPRAEEIIGLPDDKDSSDAIGVDIRELPPIIETGEADLFTRLKYGETIEFDFPFESIYGKEAYFTGRAVPLYHDGEFDGALLMATDISERRQHERELERQRDELETLNRINDLLLEITRDLFESPTRAGIEQMVCDRLAASDLYQFAWIGTPEPGEQRIRLRASAGIDDGDIETASVETTGDGPAARAFRTGEIQVSQTHSPFEPWPDTALDRDINSTAAIPLVHGDTTYGILAVYGTRPLAFSQREQEGFETLGKAVGFAVNAIENRKLLFADTVVELEFEVTDPELVFVRIAAQLECQLSITGVVASESGTWSVYVTVEGATPTAVLDAARGAPDVDDVRIIAGEDDGGLLEFVLDGPALTEITKHGAILTSGHVDAERGRFCIEAPQTTDAHRLSERLQATYPNSTLVAKREFDRPARKAEEIRQSLDERLTDRQQEALERAYHAGYFDWPRTSTAGDVADSMDVAETTFHYHLRNALETLLMAVIDLEEQ